MVCVNSSINTDADVACSDSNTVNTIQICNPVILFFVLFLNNCPAFFSTHVLSFSGLLVAQEGIAFSGQVIYVITCYACWSEARLCHEISPFTIGSVGESVCLSH